MKYSNPLENTVFFNSVYRFHDLDAYENSIAEGEFIYARDGHPNAKILQTHLAEWEHCQWGLVTSSGMGAISSLIFAMLSSGKKLLAGMRLYGRTLKVFQKDLTRFGIQVTLVDECDLDAVQKALQEKQDLFFLESITNPTLRVPPLLAIRELTREYGCLLAVDNTFASPVIFRPMDLGADFVLESLTKIICGHSDSTLGFVGGNAWKTEVTRSVCDLGFNAGPFDCHLLSRSLETLEMRVKRSCENARELAPWLNENYPALRVEYPGLKNHPDQVTAEQQMGALPGHLLSVDIPGGREGVNRFLHAARDIPFCPSLGHSTTTCSHSWSTSHRQLEPEEKIRQGITEGLLRVSLGLESQEKIREEFAKGLKAAGT